MTSLSPIESRAQLALVGLASLDAEAATQKTPKTAKTAKTAKGTHGGARAGAGRKPGKRRNVPHRARPRQRSYLPSLVTLRAASGLGSFRRESILRLFKELLADQQRRHGASFRIPHFSIQSNHLHLIVEAAPGALTRGIRALVIAFARRFNRLLRRTGRVWGDRYHRRDLSSPREMKNALVYVLNNDLRHGFVRVFGNAAEGEARTDVYSSGPLFNGWSKRTAPITYAVPWVDMRPKTWLLVEGWKKYGLVDPMKKPGPVKRI